MVELACLPKAQRPIRIAWVSHESRRQRCRIRGSLRRCRRNMGSQDESGITQETSAPKGHARHRQINDHLDKRVCRRLDEFDEAWMELACSRFAKLVRALGRYLARWDG